MRAVTRAHQARLLRGAGLVDVVMAAWKLIALLLLVGGGGAMANQVTDPPWPLGEGFLGDGTRAGSGSWQFGPDHMAFNWTNGTWPSASDGAWTHLGVIHHLWYDGTWGTLPFLDWHTSLRPAYDPFFVMAAFGVLLVGYAARTGQTLLRRLYLAARG